MKQAKMFYVAIGVAIVAVATLVVAACGEAWTLYDRHQIVSQVHDEIPGTTMQNNQLIDFGKAVCDRAHDGTAGTYVVNYVASHQGLSPDDFQALGVAVRATCPDDIGALGAQFERMNINE